MSDIAHIVNPVMIDESSDLFGAQPITFETMQKAKRYSEKLANVELFSAQFPEDRIFIPDFFTKTHNLERSILDIGKFKKNRKLPLIKDIIDRLYDFTEAEYLIYTNVDIALMPYFYVAVKKIIEAGYDAFTINRRTINKEYSDIDQIYLMFSQVGEKHPGHDCFIFKKSLYPKFILGDTCIGADWVGRVLISNLICHSKKFKVFHDFHLTFHIGDDRSWKTEKYSDYDNHNKNELHKILLKYKSMGILKDHPLIHRFLSQIEAPRSETSHPEHKLSCFRERIKRFLTK